MTDTSQDSSAASAPPDRDPPTVLVVEDDPRVRHVTCSRLGDLGYRVLEAGVATAAIELLAKDPNVDLLFSDLVMPGEMSGIDLARRVRELYPAMRIVLTSGYAAELSHAAEEDLGLQVLRKPYSQETLVRVIGEALRAG
jgi:CheY-like chemotaxis protein